MKSFIKDRKFIIFLVSILGIFCIVSLVFASPSDWPRSPLFGTELTDETELPEFIGYIYEWGIGLGGIIAFVALLIAGFLYISSAGNPSAMQDAKDRIFSAGIGLGVLLGSWLILNTINPQLTQLQLPPFEPGEIIEITATSTDMFSIDSKPCAEAMIKARTETTFKPEKCTSLTIETDATFDIQGYTKDGEATSCAGFVNLFSGTKCETAVATYILSGEGGLVEDASVDETIQTVKLVVPK